MAAASRRYDNVLRDIRGLFVETAWTDQVNGQSHLQYPMSRDGFALLAMGFTGARHAVEARLRRRL